ncbi:type II toxin-antitoxin system Phd/YefM family antitoxin [Alcanivorax marinus]|uniref:Antitoxin n=1 Tax=Alloalcanivorax marinus TaxID=1177169 RepID=A0A9Q3UQW3_9GAMM|nr:type II toxin-antitoxin system Phd/YefM family antitoxin [Alloalcanivorax marinus]MCC4310436.1 type II toxin-antitoxin system Phd/YefM family antitoxin [Alloalcanivorax marinus]MCU5785565.1 prevent-host-death family protein [Alloalcanivorax marinus]
MSARFSEDVVPLSDLKANPDKVIDRVQESHRPVLLTSRGRGVAVVQRLEDYERIAEELRFVKAVAQGLMEAREGDVSMEQARWQQTLRAMESAAQGKVVDAGAVHDWLASWGTEDEKDAPESGQ